MSQHSGNISITSQGVKLIEDEVSITKELGNLSENLGKKIPKSLIQECDDKYESTGIPHIILDASDNYKIKNPYYKEEKREVSLDYLLDNKFEVVSWYDLMEMPSRDTFYDSVTKHTDLFERHKKVLTFLNGLDFFITDLLESGLSQQELLFNSFNKEISYTSEYLKNSIIRVKPNLLIEMSISPNKNDSVEINKRYCFFYDPKRIYELLIENSDSENSRNLKLKQIL